MQRLQLLLLLFLRGWAVKERLQGGGGTWCWRCWVAVTGAARLLPCQLLAHLATLNCTPLK